MPTRRQADAAHRQTMSAGKVAIRTEGQAGKADNKDQCATILVAAGHNIRLLLAWPRIFCALLLATLSATAVLASATSG